MQQNTRSSLVTAYRLLGLVLLLAAATILPAQQQPRTYAGFDRNLYPGDDALAALHRTFAFTGYWLNHPPGEAANTWTGKRELLLRHGFGFAVLFNGHIQKELNAAQQPPTQLGADEATLTIRAAKHEGFPPKTIIFLDMEEGGRMLPQQAAYLFAWMDAVIAGGYRAGVYCSGIPVPDGPHQTITTAQDITSKKRQPPCCALGSQRRLPTGTRLHHSATHAQCRSQWYWRRYPMAVCPVAAAPAVRRQLPRLQYVRQPVSCACQKHSGEPLP